MAEPIVCFTLRLEVFYLTISSQGHVETLSELLEAAHDPSLDADEIDNLAESILKDCKKTSPISSLETALYLLHEARGLRPGNTSSNYLALSLVAKFIWTDQVSGLDEAIKLKGPLEICQNCGKPHEDDVPDPVCEHDIHDPASLFDGLRDVRTSVSTPVSRTKMHLL